MRFPNRTGFYTKTLKILKPLESRRGDISVEKRDLTDLSPVGAVSVDIYGEKLRVYLLGYFFSMFISIVAKMLRKTPKLTPTLWGLSEEYSLKGLFISELYYSFRCFQAFAWKIASTTRSYKDILRFDVRSYRRTK